MFYLKTCEKELYLKMISNVSLQNNFSTKALYFNTMPVSFSSNKTNQTSDSFERTDKLEDKSKYFWMAATFTTLIALFATKLKSIKAFKNISKYIEAASKDSLTGLYNKGILKSDIKQIFPKMMEEGKDFSVAMLDMDNFKSINEVFNHKTGDEFLAKIADNINNVTQKHKIKGYRFGGEEFTVLMPNTNKEKAYSIISEIAESIKNDEFIQSYLPDFQEKVGNDIIFLNNALENLDTKIFRNLRHRQGEKLDNYTEISNSVASLIENHIKKYDPSNRNNLDEILNRLRQAKPEELPELLSIHTKIGTSTLGTELDNIHHQYTRIRNFSQDWMNNLERNKKFTISGGVATLNKDTIIAKPEDDIIKIADAALKSAKENGKNTIVTADESLIKKALEEK